MVCCKCNLRNENQNTDWNKLHRFQRFSLWFCMAYLYSSSNLVSTFSSYIYYVKMCFFTSFMSWSLARTSYLKDVTDSSHCCIAHCSKQKENINFRFPMYKELVLLIKINGWPNFFSLVNPNNQKKKQIEIIKSETNNQKSLFKKTNKNHYCIVSKTEFGYTLVGLQIHYFQIGLLCTSLLVIIKPFCDCKVKINCFDKVTFLLYCRVCKLICMIL